MSEALARAFAAGPHGPGDERVLVLDPATETPLAEVPAAAGAGGLGQNAPKHESSWRFRRTPGTLARWTGSHPSSARIGRISA